MHKVMNLDSSARYFKFVDDYLFFKLPPELSTFVLNDIKENMDKRIRNTINEGILKLIIDVSALEEVEENAIEIVGEFAEKIEDMKLPIADCDHCHRRRCGYVEQLGRVRRMEHLRRFGRCQREFGQRP